MRSASVGFQCPDDVAEGARTVRQPRTVFGGRVSGDTSRISLGLVVANVAVFLLGLLLGEGQLALRFGNIAGPALLEPGGEPSGVAAGEYYRLLTAAFLHAGALHLAFNMFALATVGPQLESALGRVRFAALYGLSALGGSVLSLLLSTPDQLGVGASGAIFGLFGAFYIVVRRLGGETRSIVSLLVINLVITVVVPGIDWRAHLGGFLTGLVVAAAFAHVPRSGARERIHLTACAAVAVLLVAVAAARVAALT